MHASDIQTLHCILRFPTFYYCTRNYCLNAFLKDWGFIAKNKKNNNQKPLMLLLYNTMSILLRCVLKRIGHLCGTSVTVFYIITSVQRVWIAWRYNGRFLTPRVFIPAARRGGPVIFAKVLIYIIYYIIFIKYTNITIYVYIFYFFLLKHVHVNMYINEK